MTGSAPIVKTLRAVSTTAGVLLLILAAAGTAIRYLPVTNQALVVTATLSPYLMLAGLVAPLIFLVTRHWTLAVISLLLTIAILVTLVPRFLPAARPSEESAALRVMTANVYEGHADPAGLVNTATRSADVLSVQELTPEAAEKFSAAGLDAVFPYRVLETRRGASGTGLWSRFPISASRVLDGYVHAMVIARLRMPEVGIDPTVFAAHLPAPVPGYLDEWNRELGELRAVFGDIAAAAGAGCVIVAGDLNSTPAMKPFRDLLEGGYGDASDQAGAGLTPTYPADREFIPPVFPIDHILTRHCAATSVVTIDVPGSDHRGLVAEVLIPAGGSD